MPFWRISLAGRAVNLFFKICCMAAHKFGTKRRELNVYFIIRNRSMFLGKTSSFFLMQRNEDFDRH